MTVRLAVDAMGGDNGISVTIPAAALFLKNTKTDVQFSFYGCEKELSKALLNHPNLSKFSTIHHTDDIIAGGMKPSTAIRKGRASSMAKAVEAVSNGECDAVLSAGNTGAYMAFSKIYLKTFDDIDRPAIPAVMPSMSGQVLVLDVGANIDCTPLLLTQFAKMGRVYAQFIMGIQNPTLGLLNIGSEEQKGDAVLQDTFGLLQNNLENFQGFVEGDDIGKGNIDVVVTDGFTGNVVLKAIEGSAKLFGSILKNSLKSTWRGPLAYILGKPAFQKFKTISDPRLYNGAVFLGLKKIAVKSHGGTDIIGFANAIKISVDMVAKNLPHHIEKSLNA